MPDVIGIDHIYIAVTDLVRAEAFYDQVMPVLGFRKDRFSLDGDPHVQYFNRHFGYVLRPARSDFAHDPYAAGLHHLCFRVDSTTDVGTVALQLKTAGIEASSPRLFPEYAPDYWATFFSDPDGLRLEVTNYRAERRQRHDEWITRSIGQRNPESEVEKRMAFAENLKKLPGVESVEKIELFDAGGKLVATLENKPGQAGSLAVYAYLLGKYRRIDASAATEGLALFAEHTSHAEQNPGKHPNIDRLFDVVKRNLVHTGTVTAR